MRFKNLPKVKGYPTVTDLDLGDTFMFLTEDNLYMLTEDLNGSYYIIVNLGTGETINPGDYEDIPIQKVEGYFSCYEETSAPVGIVRTVDDCGRIAIPKEFRKHYEIVTGHESVLISCTDEGILIKPYNKEEE